MKIETQENLIKGSWIITDGGIINDNVSERIYDLISNYLIKIKTDESGWNTLFKDPFDNRYWELIYLESEMQGGGPPTLRYISDNETKIKYNI